jgi:lipoyl(octanoyl) transferase
MPDFDVIDLGRLDWAAAWSMQEAFVQKRKQGLVPDTLFYVEHPPVITLGRNAEARHILASPAALSEQGIALHEANRGGDVTFHGPGQLVGYPVFDLSGWRKDVRAYVQGLEEAIVRTLAEFGLQAHTRSGKETGVYVHTPAGVPAKICALGVHISRWVTCHGFALNIDTDLRYFENIVPCGLSLPVTSMREQGSAATRAAVQLTLTRQLAAIFTFNSPTTDNLPVKSGLELEEIHS